MVFDSEGVLRDDEGAELARSQPGSGQAYARLIVGPDTYEIDYSETLRTRFRLIDAAGQLVYEFHQGLRHGGTVALASGEPAAQIARRWISGRWRIVPAGREEIDVRREEGLAGSVVAEDGTLVPPALEISLPSSQAAAADLRLLLAFGCWLIAGWETGILSA
jgi:FtsP/CotA-like multicopper oxidase with cupredoxin domain